MTGRVRGGLSYGAAWPVISPGGVAGRSRGGQDREQDMGGVPGVMVDLEPAA